MPDAAMPALVIFDCDGVLVDSEVLGNRVLVEFLADLGVTMGVAEAVALFRGCKMADCVAEVERRLGRSAPSSFVEELRARTAAAFERDLRPVDGVAAAIDALTIPICVASSGPMEKIRLALKVTGLLTKFEGRIFSSYEVKSWKPEPGLLLHASRAMGAAPAACTVIEDSVPGVRAGVSAGMRVLGYAPDPQHAAVLAAEGAITFHTMSVLPRLLDH